MGFVNKCKRKFKKFCDQYLKTKCTDPTCNNRLEKNFKNQMHCEPRQLWQRLTAC